LIPFVFFLHQVREAGYRAIEVDFVAVGDGSMGSLQHLGQWVDE
jgi:hypothetical protein